MKCVVCERDTEGSVEIAMEIHFPVTGSVQKGTMHLPCAIHALQELRQMYVKGAENAERMAESKPS